MARNFIIFFEEKEGTSPLVRMLDQFQQVDIIHQTDNKAWEPFNVHNCGPMSRKDLGRCLDFLYNRKPLNFEEINKIYQKTASRPLHAFNTGEIVGCKMRFKHPQGPTAALKRIPIVGKAYAMYDNSVFSNLMYDVLKRNEVVAFIAVRQDVLRQALSKYHGDGTGRPGHLQFKLAEGQIKQEDIAKMHVDCNRLEKLIEACKESINRKKVLMQNLSQNGIQTHALLYEDFCSRKQEYFEDIFSFLGSDISKEEISDVIGQGSNLKKVHSDDISEFVINSTEVLDKFGDSYVPWSCS